MPIYTGVQSVLNAALGRYQYKGFRLVRSHVSDNELALFYADSCIAHIPDNKATIPNIHTACHDHLVSIGQYDG